MADDYNIDIELDIGSGGGSGLSSEAKTALMALQAQIDALSARLGALIDGDEVSY